MPHIWKDRVAETSTSTGTGAFTLAGAIAGFQAFSAVCSVADTLFYSIEGVDGNGVPTGEWETGLGTYSASNTLTRTTVTESSNAGAAVNFSAGTKRVMLTIVASSISTRLDSTGKQTIPLLAAALTPRTTSGAAAGTAESTTNKVMSYSLDFDQTTAEYAQIMLPMPKSWDESTITAQAIWTASATGDVVWGFRAVALSDDDALDAAFGTAVTVTDGVTAAGDVMISAETAAITIAGTPAEGDLVVFEVYRDASSGSDTLGADAKLLAVKLFITTNAAADT